jgi:hypothetical protein
MEAFRGLRRKTGEKGPARKAPTPVGKDRLWEKDRIPYNFTIEARSFDGNRFLLKAQCSKLKAQSRFGAAGPTIEFRALIFYS